MPYRPLWLAAALLGVAAACSGGGKAHPVLSHSPLPDLAGRGTITGSFLAVGGPAGAPNEPQRGRILVRDNGRTTLTVRVAQDGRFSFQVLPGRYSLVGYSPQYNGGDAACQGARPSFAVRAGHRTLINVYCQRK